MVRQLVPLRQEDVAALTGLSQSYLSMLECGDRRLTDVSRVVQFLTGLGTPPDLVRLPLPGISPLPDAAAPTRTASSGQAVSAPVTVTPTAPDPTLPWTADRMLSALRLAHVADNTADWPGKPPANWSIRTPPSRCTPPAPRALRRTCRW